MAREDKLKSYIPGENNSVLQYALGNSQEPRRNSMAFEVVQKRHSTSVLKTFARNSMPYAHRMPEDLDSAYARQFTVK